MVCGVSICMGRMLQLGLGLLVALSAYRVSSQTTTNLRTVSICDIRSQPRKYLGQVVTVTGEVQRTGHSVGMSSAQCPSVGAVLIESKHEQEANAPESRLFREGTWDTFLCTNPHVFVVTVRGRFGTAVMRGIPGYRIVIERVMRAEFTQQTSSHCINQVLPPPDVKFPTQPMPDLFRPEP